jgi:hypothetical protein
MAGDESPLERAVLQFKQVCILRSRLDAAQRLLSRYMATIPVTDRPEYARRTQRMQEEYDKE